ncbi:hypothetical protein T492DRAFT_905774, partial [Pavlovales sp. CCMP2436]
MVVSESALPSLEEVRAADFRVAVATICPPICQALERDDPAAAPLLNELFRSSDGVRGFFVNWLTDPSLTRPDSANPPPALLAAMAQSPDERMLSELMVMNVIMPSATSLAHQRNGDVAASEASRLTARRASALVSCAAMSSAREDMLAVLA